MSNSIDCSIFLRPLSNNAPTIFFDIFQFKYPLRKGNFINVNIL